MPTTLTRTDLAGIAERAIHATLGGSLNDLTALVHADAVNREAIAEPPATRGVGPAAFHATGEWLRAAFSDMVWTTERDVVDDDLVVSYGTLSGRQTGEFVVWTPEGAVERAFVPTGKTFTVRQAHFQRIVDGSSSSTGRSATTRAWRSSSAGSHPAPASCSVATGPPSGCAEPPERRHLNRWRHDEIPPNDRPAGRRRDRGLTACGDDTARTEAKPTMNTTDPSPSTPPTVVKPRYPGDTSAPVPG